MMVDVVSSAKLNVFDVVKQQSHHYIDYWRGMNELAVQIKRGMEGAAGRMVGAKPVRLSNPLDYRKVYDDAELCTRAMKFMRGAFLRSKINVTWSKISLE